MRLHFPGIASVIDILIVLLAVYMVLRLIRGTRAVQLLKGLAVFFAVLYLTRRFNLNFTYGLLSRVRDMLLIAIPIVFYPELRRALEQLGRGWPWNSASGLGSEEEIADTVSRMVISIYRLAARRHGALVVFERAIGLAEYVATGTRLMASVSPELLETVFQPQTALHDGAVIIRGETMLAAGCFLPLSDRHDLPQRFGTRHRAALGLSEVTDAVALVISEESGSVSLARDGNITVNMSRDDLEAALRDVYREYRRASHFLSADDIGLWLKERVHG